MSVPGELGEVRRSQVNKFGQVSSLGHQIRFHSEGHGPGIPRIVRSHVGGGGAGIRAEGVPVYGEVQCIKGSLFPTTRQTRLKTLPPDDVDDRQKHEIELQIIIPCH